MHLSEIAIPLLGTAFGIFFLWKLLRQRRGAHEERLSVLQLQLEEANSLLKETQRAAREMLRMKRLENDFAHRVDGHIKLADLSYELQQALPQEFSLTRYEDSLVISPDSSAFGSNYPVLIATSDKELFNVSVVIYYAYLETYSREFMEHLLRQNAASPAAVFGLEAMIDEGAWLTVNCVFEAGEVEEDAQAVTIRLVRILENRAEIHRMLETFDVTFSFDHYSTLIMQRQNQE